MIQIPLAQIPAQTFQIVLAEQNCTISVYWRQKRLYLDLSVSDIPICIGAICQNRAEILQSPSPDFLGSLHFFDTEGDSPPLWEEVDTGASGRWILLYFEDGEEIPELLRY